MRPSGSTSAFARLPWSHARARAQFHPEPRLDVKRSAQRPDAYKPLSEKRTEPAGAAPIEISFGPFRLLPTQFLLLESDKAVPLDSWALEILIVLLEKPGELISKQELMVRIWSNAFVVPSNLTVHTSALRRALHDGRDGNRFIINIPENYRGQMEHKQTMSSNGVHGTLRFGPFELSRSKRVLRRNGATLPLGSRAFDILVYLAERPGEVIGKKELIDHVWPKVTVEEGSLRVHVAAIRKALGDGQFGDRYIANVKGRGYSFIGSVVRFQDSTENVSEWSQYQGRRPERAA
jgi:DNA-binding winged helix-turn-helix (wHTH) protein